MEKELTSAMTWNLLDDLHEGVIIAENDGTILYSNHAAESLLGLDSTPSTLSEVDDLLAASPALTTLLPPPAATDLSLANGRFLQAQTKRQNFSDQELIRLLLTPQTKPAAPERPAAALEQLSALTRINNESDFNKQLQMLVDGLQDSGWNRVVLSLRDEQFNPTQILTAGFSQSERAYLRENMLPPEMWLKIFKDETLPSFRRGACYFVPGTSEWSQENLEMILPDPTANAHDETAWHPMDLLCIPLYDREQRRIGLIGLDQPVNGRRPDSATLQTIELYAQFAASIIENASLYREAVNRNKEFEMLLDASNALSSTLEMDTVLTLIGNYMLQAAVADGYTIYKWHSTENKLTVLRESAPDLSAKTAAPGTAVPLPDSEVLQQVIYEQEPLIIYTAEQEMLPLPLPAWLKPDAPCNCALLPLVLSGETYGLIHLIGQRNERQPFSPRKLQLLTALAQQASTALETTLIFEDTYERERFYGALGNVSLALNSTLNRETVLNLICSEGRRIFQVDGAYIWQLEGNHFVGSAADGHGEALFKSATTGMNSNQTFVSHLAQTGEAAFLNDVHQSSEFRIELPAADKVQSVLGVPLTQEGNLTGVLILADTKNPNRFNPKDVARATTFGVQVAIALQNAKLFDELREFNEKLDQRVAKRTKALNEESSRVKLLLRITSELSASLDQDRVLNKALVLVNEMVNATDGAILLIDHESGEFIFRASLDSERPLPPKGIPSGMMRHEGLAGWMIENRSAVIVHDTSKDERWVKRASSLNHNSALGVPLISNEEVIGVLMMFHKEKNAFTMQQLDLVEAAAIQVANAINNASLYQLIFEQAEQLGSMLRNEIIQKANLRAILESIADGVIVADSDNKISIANLPACNILDIPRDQLIGKSINELLGVYGHFGETWLHTIEAWAKNADRIEQWTYLADQLTLEDKFVSVHLSPVLSDSQFYGTVSIFRDITKEVEVDKLKSEFVSTVSHELRTPMTSIKGYADLMLMGAAGSMSDPQLRYLQVIKNNADRLHMLVNDLLNISRIETGKTTLDLRPLDVPQIIDQVVEGHLNGRIQHEDRHLSVTTEIAPSLPLVNADHARVTQILTNLLDNALNYTPDNGEIKVSVKATRNFVFISVADTGIGIAQENLDKIFDRFFRAEDEQVQKIPGTGLGLAIVRSLIEMHGGFLEVESTPGEGSVFTFNLPIVVEDTDPT